MPCLGPLTMYRPKPGAPNRRLTSRKSDGDTGIGIKVPCGQCVGCRMERARQWAMRCLHEKRLHNRSSFVTLTYSNSHLPEFGNLVKRDLQLFMKRVRFKYGDGIRFFACGEYGEENQRPHFHVLFFNLDFDDKRFYRKTAGGDDCYVSPELADLWGKGLHEIGEVNFKTCSYVARYVLKKVTGRASDEHYMVYDADGVVHVRNPEFTVMSRRPGIGLGWYDKFGAEVRAHDSVIINGREVKPPRYYDDKYKALDPVAFERLKVKRRRQALLFKSDQTSRRRRVKEIIQLTRLARLKREI